MKKVTYLSFYRTQVKLKCNHKNILFRIESTDVVWRFGEWDLRRSPASTFSKWSCDVERRGDVDGGRLTRPTTRKGSLQRTSNASLWGNVIVRVDQLVFNRFRNFVLPFWWTLVSVSYLNTKHFLLSDKAFMVSLSKLWNNMATKI
jgi:hypothetical protein